MAFHDSQDLDEWSKAIETGNEAMDSEHVRLFQMLRDLHEMASAPVAPDCAAVHAFGQVLEYAVLHFSNEELIMDSCNYGESEEHKQIHAGFLVRFRSLLDDGDVTWEGASNYVAFIYDWLVSHICTMDQAMVTSMQSGALDYRGSLGDQTNLIINTAMNVAQYLTYLTTRLNDSHDKAERGRIKAEIDSTSERLLNLISLADSRVDLWGGSDAYGQKMTKIKGAITKSACNLMEQYAIKIINYGGRILSGKSGVPMGCGAVIANLVSAIETIAVLVGENEALTVAQSSVVIRAFDVANQVTGVIAHHFAKSKFSHVVDSSYSNRQYVVPKTVMARSGRQANLFTNNAEAVSGVQGNVLP